MAFKFQQSSEGHSSNLALFTPKPVDAATNQVQFVEYRPVSQLNHGSPIEFNISGTGMEYINLKDTRLHFEARILRPDGMPVSPADATGLINIPLQSLFRMVDVSLNGVVMNASVGTAYPYKAYIDIISTCSEDILTSQYQSILYYKDTAGYCDRVNPVDGPNFGLVERYGWTKDGNSVDLEGPLFVDVMRQDKLLLNGVQVNITLYPSTDSFCLMSDGNAYTVDITSAVLKVCTHRPQSAVILAHDKVLQSTPAIYDYNRSDIKAFSVPAGLFNYSIEDPFLGTVPTRLFVGLVPSQAFNGSYARNPFNFSHFDVSYLGFFVDSESRPGVALKPNYKNRNYMNEYLTMFAGLGKLGKTGSYVDRNEFPYGYCTYLFDLATTHDDDVINLSKRSHTRLSIQFEKALPEPVSIILYGVFPATMQITHERNIIVN